MKDDSGGFVKSRLDEPALKAIAAATGGQYAPLGAQGQGFETIYRSSLAPLLKHDLASRQQKVYIQRYQWPLAGSLALLLASLLIGTRRRMRVRRRDAKSPPRPALADAAAVSVLALLSLMMPARPVRASTASAEEAYKKGDFATAAREYAAEAKQLSQEARAAIQRRHGRLPRRAVPAGGTGVSGIDQPRPIGRREAPGRPRGRVLQPRQHAVPQRAEDRGERSSANRARPGHRP